jgi:LPS-assembly lipoprotein
VSAAPKTFRVQKVRRAVAALCAALALASCGFHLRGAQALPYESVYVNVPSSSELRLFLVRAIELQAGSRVVENAGLAQARLTVTREEREKSILSLDSSGQVREFQLRYRIAYLVDDGKGTVLVPERQLALARDVTFDASLLLAKQFEDELLYRDMLRDAAQQIVRRLALVGRKATGER